MTRYPTYSLLLMLLLPPVAAAQSPPESRVSLTTAIAYTSQWDDETHLGSGVLLSVGVTRVVGSTVRLEGELSIARHTRDSGYLAATGTPIVGTARAAWLIGPSGWRARPFVSAGAALTHSRGEFRSTHIMAGPDGRPVEGEATTRTWRVTEPGVELGTGVELRGRGRMWWRPELRLAITRGHAEYRPGVDTLETPIVTVRAGMTVGW